jgi:hypothetical protein
VQIGAPGRLAALPEIFNCEECSDLIDADDEFTSVDVEINPADPAVISTIRSGPLRCLHMAHQFWVSCSVTALADNQRQVPRFRSPFSRRRSAGAAR